MVGQAPPAGVLPTDYQPFQGVLEMRLAKLGGFALPGDLWAHFDRIDLLGWCPGRKPRKAYHDKSTGYKKHDRDGHLFPLREARLVASRLRQFGGLATSYAVVVLCGRYVASAFDLAIGARTVPWTDEVDGIRYLVLPHPSGASHFWNDEVAWHRAAGTFRAVLGRVGLGTQLPFTLRDKVVVAALEDEVANQSRDDERDKEGSRASSTVGRTVIDVTGPSVLYLPYDEGQARMEEAARVTSRFFDVVGDDVSDASRIQVSAC